MGCPGGWVSDELVDFHGVGGSCFGAGADQACVVLAGGIKAVGLHGDGVQVGGGVQAKVKALVQARRALTIVARWIHLYSFKIFRHIIGDWLCTKCTRNSSICHRNCERRFGV